MTTESETEFRHLLRLDWAVTETGMALHFVDEATGIFDEDHWAIRKPILACGRVPDTAYVPVPVDRMWANRCKRCCDAVGIPHGVGSPKNDPDLRIALLRAEEPA